MRFEDMRVGMRVVGVNVSHLGYEDRIGKLATINKLSDTSPTKYFVWVTWDDEELNEKYPHLSYSYSDRFFNPAEDNMSNPNVNEDALRAAWNLLSDASGIGEGDTVRITRGWEAVVPHKYGIGSVKSLIGKEVDIKGTREVCGFRALVLEHGLFVPYNVVELVKKAKPAWKPQVVKINGSYDATVYAGHVIVGCQMVSFEAVKRLFAMVIKAEEHAKGY